MSTLNIAPELIPHQATHPGKLIADELEARDEMNQKELAHLLDVKPSFLNEIIKGKRPISADTALLLEKALGISAEFWLKFQLQYDLDVARIKERNIVKVNNIEVWNIIKTYIPVNQFKKLGYLGEDIEYNIQKIYSIFKVSNIDEFINQYAVRKLSFYRKSEKLTVDEKNLFTWSVLAEYEASQIETEDFDSGCQAMIIHEINQLFFKNSDLWENLKNQLNKFGIKLLHIEKFEKTAVDGYSFWSGKNPSIVLSLRHKRLDYLAFTLMHELGHVFLHLQQNKNFKFLDIDEKEYTQFEKEADDFARENLISTSVWNLFKTLKFPPSDQDIIDFAQEYGIHPFIIFGRMCFEQNQYKMKTMISKEIH